MNTDPTKPLILCLGDETSETTIQSKTMNRPLRFWSLHHKLTIKSKVNVLIKYPNYEWYYKPHTYDLSVDKSIHDKTLKNYPNVIQLDAKVIHNQIINSKLFCMITNRGSVGHEYAAFKIPVIFTEDNKHINYKFRLYAKSKREIEVAIMNNKLFKKNI